MTSVAHDGAAARTSVVSAPARRITSRHPGDAVRVGLAAAVLGVALLAVERDRLTLFERDLFRLVNDLPSVLQPGLVFVMQGGNLLAAPFAALVALLRRAHRLALDLAMAGPLAWFAAKAVKRLVERPRPSGLVDDLARGQVSAGMGFVSGHTAVAVALATAAAPYLPRRWRRVVWSGAWLVGLARVYEGAHLPMDIVGGAAVGWGIGALIHLLLGAPHRAPRLQDARAALERAGLRATRVAAVPGEPQGSFPFVATVDGRELFVKLLDPEPRDRDLLYRVARFLAFRDVREEAAVGDPLQQAEHEAALTLLARSGGVRAPAIERVQRLGRRVWIVEDAVGSTSLAVLPAAEVTDQLLRDVWDQVRSLHGAAIAHRDLVADNIVVGDDGRPWIVDFAHAVSAPAPASYDNDVAELLVALAGIVGPRRAVGTAHEVLGRTAVTGALPELQPLALTASARRRLRAEPALLGALRAEIASLADLSPSGPARTGTTTGVARLLPVAGAATALLVLVAVGGSSATWRALTSGSWRWAGFGVLLAAVMFMQRAAALVAASGRPLGLGRTLLAGLVASGAQPASPRDAVHQDAIGGYLTRSGLAPERAAGALAAWRSTQWVVLGTGLLVTAGAVAAEHASWRWSADVAVLAGAALLLGVVTGVSALGGAGGSAGSRDGRSRLGVDRTVVLVAATAAEAALGASVVLAALKTIGGPAPVAATVLVVLASRVAVLVRAAPGSQELLLAAGLTAVGIDASTAVAATVLAGLLTSWLPGLVGWVGAGPLRRHLVV